MNAHCAKIAAESKKEKKRKLEALNKEYLKNSKGNTSKVSSPTMVRYEDPEVAFMLTNKDNHNNEEEIAKAGSSSLELRVGSLEVAESIEVHTSTDAFNSVDQVDGNGDSSSYDSSSPQVHSPLRTVISDSEALLNADESVV